MLIAADFSYLKKRESVCNNDFKPALFTSKK